MSASTALIFDVDGTLTPSRGAMDPDFQRWFLDLCVRLPVSLVTGGAREQTLAQVGSAVYNAAQRVYNNSGNDVWQGDTHVRCQAWHPEHSLLSWLEHELVCSVYRGARAGGHITQRTGTLNFSTVGSAANAEQRAHYVQWDSTAQERRGIAQRLQWYFPHLEAAVGGEISIDIYPRGANKSQILADFPGTARLIFYGDRLDAGGNDAALAQAVRECGGQAHAVRNWQHTWQLLWEKYQ